MRVKVIGVNTVAREVCTDTRIQRIASSPVDTHMIHAIRVIFYSTVSFSACSHTFWKIAFQL